MTIERETYTPHTAGEVVGVHSNTIRLWVTQYGVALSESARMKPAKFTPADVAVFQRIKELRAAGLEPTDIVQRLQQTPKADLQRPYIEVTAENAVEAPESDSRSNTSTDAAIARPSPSTGLELSAVQQIVDLAGARMTEIDGRIAKLEKQRSIVIAAAIGAVIGAGLVVVGFWLAILATR